MGPRVDVLIGTNVTEDLARALTVARQRFKAVEAASGELRRTATGVQAIGWNSIIGVEGIHVEMGGKATVLGAIVAVGGGWVTIEHLPVAISSVVVDRAAVEGRKGLGHVLGGLGTGVRLEMGHLMVVVELLLILLLIPVDHGLGHLLKSVGCLNGVLLEGLVFCDLQVLGVTLFDKILRRLTLGQFSECAI